MNIRAVGLSSGVVLLAVVFAAGGAFAQGRMGGGQAPAHYSAAAEITVKGTVDEMKPGPQQGMHVLLKTSDGTLELVLGPTWYQTEQKYALAKGDQVDVIGARTKVDGREVLLVREIKKGAETMTFRDAKGFPLWSQRGGR
jgi:hypothetical protein